MRRRDVGTGRPGRASDARVRLVATGLRGVGFVLMMVGVWATPVVVLLAGDTSVEPGVTPSPWRLWGLLEVSLASLVASYLVWSVADWLDELRTAPR